MNRVEQDKWTVPLYINGAVLLLKLDTVPKANLMNGLSIRATKVKQGIHPNSVPLKTYNGQLINTKGIFRFKVRVKGKKTTSCL